MVTPLDVLHRVSNQTARAAERLRAEIEAARGILNQLDEFTRLSEATTELAAASDLYPTWSSKIPPASGLVRPGPSVNIDDLQREGMEALHQLDRQSRGRASDEDVVEAIVTAVLRKLEGKSDG